MIRKVKFLSIVMSLLICVAGTSGCVMLLGAAAGAGGYAWKRGSLEKKFDVPVKELHKAAVKGLQKLDIKPLEERSDNVSGRIVAEFADGKNLKISIEAITEKTSKLDIRVGVMGDKTKSEMVLNSLEKSL